MVTVALNGGWRGSGLRGGCGHTQRYVLVGSEREPAQLPVYKMVVNLVVLGIE